MMAGNILEQQKTILGIKDIVEILPHRYPFLLLDKVIELDIEREYIVGLKNVTANESFFQGHFPDVPIMPGVLILESLAQTGAVLLHQKGHVGKLAILLNISNAKFRHSVHPGDTLHLYVQGQHITNRGGRVEAKAMVNDEVAVEAEIGFTLVDKNQV